VVRGFIIILVCIVAVAVPVTVTDVVGFDSVGMCVHCWMQVWS